ncbi:MAG TPA: cation:proton antiporter, partial [Ktedonobacteraceae bacterium]
MHDFPIIINITVALIVALIGGLIARRIKLPTIVGYLLAGVAIGPFTPGFVGDIHTIQELAELGVIFLLFGVGLHFSLRDLWSVRDIAIGGAIVQMLLATLAVIGLTHLWGWSWEAGLVVGLAVSIASTVVLLRNLTDHGWLNTSHGQVAVGWLVLEDLATVLILVLLPAFFGRIDQPIWQAAGIAILKTAAFVVGILVVGVRIIPWLLLRIAGFRSRELFIVTIVVLTLGIAVGAASFFGVSLALGAFLAGVVVHESSLSHQVEIEIQPLRETFAVLFFVSVGMLVNPLMIITRPWEILALTAMIIFGKALIVFLLGFFFRRSARTIIVIAVALSQIGEFSFLLGQTGLNLHLITQSQYSLVLMGALISITLNPLIFYQIPRIEKMLERTGPIWNRLNRHEPVPEPISEGLRDHVVLIGYGRVGKRIVDTLSNLNTPLLVIELDTGLLADLEERNIPTLFGDAANSDILDLAHLKEARAVVVAVPNDTTLLSIAAVVREIA